MTETTAPRTEQQSDEIDSRASGIASQLSGWLRRFGPIAGFEIIERAHIMLAEGVPALLADLRRARDRVAELEAYAYGCDAEGCVLPHSSWCDAAKKTAAANDGCTCGKPWTGHPQPHAMHCWTVNPPRAEVEEMRKRIAELTAENAKLIRWHREDETALAEMRATVEYQRAEQAARTAPAPAAAPPTASHGPAGDRDGETGTGGAAGSVGDSGAQRLTLTRDQLAALLAHHADVLAARWRAVAPGAGAWEVAAALSLTSHANELTAEEEPAAVAELLDNIWTFPGAQQRVPAEDFTGTQPCGHDDYHSPHPWHERPNVWCPGHSYDDDQAATEETTR